MLGKIKKWLKRPEPTYSVSWEGKGAHTFGARDGCSSAMAHKIGRVKADEGLRVTVTRWDGTKPLIEWTNT